MDTTIAGTIATAMAGAIAALWKHTTTVANRTEDRLTTKLDECEQKHGAAQKEMVALSGRVGQLEGQMEGYTQARNDMKALPDEIVKRLQAENR